MEFEDNQPITDEQRKMAEIKRLTIDPLHDTVKPEAYSEEYTAAEHIRSAAIANAPNDIEQETEAIRPTQSLISPTGSKRAPSIRTVQTGAIGAVIFIVAAIVAIILYALG